MPTITSLPPVSSTVQTLINDLFTALLYVELISNGGDSEKLCSVIDPPSLNQIPGIGINGSAIQRQVCAAGALNFYSPDLVPPFIVANQIGVSYLATALFAVQVAGNYAGGTNLSTLCAEIQTTYVNDLFGGYLLGIGTAVKDYVCSAASASPSPSSEFTDTTITPSPAFKLS